MINGRLYSDTNFILKSTGHFVQEGGSFQNEKGSYIFGTYELKGGWLGSEGQTTSGTFLQTGGTNSSAFGPQIIGQGKYELSGGEISSSMGGVSIYENGSFKQTGGNIQGGVINLSGNGTYEMSGGTISNDGLNITGNGTFTQTNGTNNSRARVFWVGSTSGCNATYNLSGDTAQSILTVMGSEDIGNGTGSTGTFNQYGGTHTLTGSMTIGTSGGSGTYNLSGGSLNVATGIVNNDQFNYSGGLLTADITNNGTYNLSGSGVRTVNGDVTNNGTVKVTNTIAQYTGNFINYGAYISDPTINLFNNLIIGENGYISSGIDDMFIISGYLENYSTNLLWNTTDSLLGFTGAGLHNIYDTLDTHWGTLAIYGGLLNLAGTGNLYVRNLFGLTFDQTGIVSNIWGNGLNIYYDALYNPWFHGNTYALLGGGSLIAYNSQAPVPEPATLLLLGAGLLGLAGFRKKFKR